MRHRSLVIVFTLSLGLTSVACSEKATEIEVSNGEPVVQATAADADHASGIVDHTVTSLAGDTVDLTSYRGRPMLIVNTASKCGFTTQYETLQELHEEYGDAGLVVIGFPSNDFGNQEPGSHDEIAEFCRLNYGVTFPMMGKVHTKGPGQAPIYRTLTTESPEEFRGEVKWNFTKFLVDGNGTVVARFDSGTDPMSDEVVNAVKAVLPATS